MSQALRTMFLMVLFAGIVTLQFNMDSDKTSTRQIKNALELAVHDAALAIDESELAYGRIIFDKDKALVNIDESFLFNLGVTFSSTGMGRTYTPDDKSFYQNPIYLEYIEFVDDNSGVEFPHLYQNPDYNIIDRLEGPSVIAVLSTKSPRYFVGEGIPIRKAVVYEYFQ